MKVSFTERALNDIDDIAAYLEVLSPAASLRVVDHIEKRCHSLQQHPRRGTLLRTTGPSELRRLIEGSYVIVYELEGRTTRVLRVLHGSRDIQAALEQDEEQGGI